MDLLVQLQAQDNQTENAIAQEEASARINQGKYGNDINTGGGTGKKSGRPNVFNTDNNGNRVNENNWENWNRNH